MEPTDTIGDDVRLYRGDAREVLPALSSSSVRCCVTSPPYFGLRDYGTATWEGGSSSCDHRSPTMRAGRNEKRPMLAGSSATNAAQLRTAHRLGCGKCGAVKVDRQIGLEGTQLEYVESLVAVFREVRRVLADDGTLWLNLGDSYCGSPPGCDGVSRSSGLAGIASETYRKRLANGCGKQRDKSKLPGLKQKDLVGIPWRVAFALQADGWYLRQDIIWSKPNPMPESVTDRCTKAHEYLFLLSKSARYYFNAAAIAEEAAYAGQGRGGSTNRYEQNAAGMDNKIYDTRNKRSVWQIAPEQFDGAHFAVMPKALVEPCVLAGSEPGDTILDPFGGSGTVGEVAIRLNRKATLIELNPEYVGIATSRISSAAGSGPGQLFGALEAV